MQVILLLFGILCLIYFICIAFFVGHGTNFYFIWLLLGKEYGQTVFRYGLKGFL